MCVVWSVECGVWVECGWSVWSVDCVENKKKEEVEERPNKIPGMLTHPTD